MSTRPFRLAGDDFDTRVTREALEGFLSQVRSRFIPGYPEHLTYLPPVVRWRDGEIVESDDGEAELLLEGTSLRQLGPTGADPQPLAIVDELLAESAFPSVNVELQYEARNFDTDEARRISDSCPVQLRRTHAWASLPPLEWVLAVPVLWVAARYAGGVLDELAHAHGKALVQWIQDVSKRAREPERHRILTVRFEVDEGRYVSAIVPFGPKTKTEELLAGLESLDAIASFAGLLKRGGANPYEGWLQGTFIFDAARWHFAWWTDGEDIYRTRWFDEECPDPTLFLGRPLVSGAGSMEGKEIRGGISAS